jgi:PAS domain S-box-containing protein
MGGTVTESIGIETSWAMPSHVAEWPFTIVGVAAGFASIVAVSELLTQLGATPDLAVIVVLLGSPETEPLALARIQEAALMPVGEAYDRLPIRPNHIYVASPHQVVELLNGRFHVSRRYSDEAAIAGVIDRLFVSMAVDAGEAAIGVVPDGTVMDAREGVREIKAHGGIIFAQDTSTEHRNMPDDAVAPGSVDYVLSPSEISTELLHIALRRREREHGSAVEHPSPLPEVLASGLGLFEDPGTFDVLQREVFPELLKGREQNDPIRVWVPGCGSGEEVYCLGLVLLEFLASVNAHVPLQLFGTDASPRTIANARKGRFWMEAMANVNERRRLSFFTYSNGTYEIAKRVRELCILAQHDMLRDPPLLHMDLISTRNTLNYLDEALREQVLAGLQYALKPRGFLLMGQSQAKPATIGLSELDARHGIFVRTDAPRRSRYFPYLPHSPSTLVQDLSARVTTPRDESARGTETDSGAPLENLSHAALHVELANTRLSLRSVIEQLEQSNEELRVVNEQLTMSNEQLQRANEELLSAKEELLASNRELTMLNQEMAARNASANRLSDDLANVLNSSEIPIVILARNARIRRFTPAAAALFGLTTSDVGRSIGAMKGALLRRIALLALEVLEKGEPAEARLPDDQGRWFMLTAHPYVTAGRAVDGAVITAIDVDEATKGKERAEAARRYAENIVNTVRESLLVLDRELRVLSANVAFYDTFELAPSQVEGLPLAKIDDGLLTLPGLREGLQRLTEGDAFDELRVAEEFRRLGFRAFVVTASRIERTPLLLLVIDDVTEKEKAKAALREQELEFREMLTNAAEGVVMAKADGSVVFANRTAAQLFGYQMHELLGRPVEALLPARFRESHRAHRRSYSEQASPRAMTDRRDIVALRRDGKEFPVEVVLSPMGRRGNTVVAFITDVSKRREAEAKIREYQDRLQRMAFDAAVAEERERRRIAVDLHDQIGQSLALARMKLDSTREGIPSTSRRVLEEAAELLSQSIVHVRTLTFDLSPPILYDLGLREALSWLVEDIETRWGITVRLDADPGPVPLEDAAAALVFRAVRELLMNVFKHARSRAASIALSRSDDHVQIDVQDQGVGFDVEDTTARQSGRGFGLFSVREQIGRLGGQVEIASAPGRGTSVVLRVPLRPAAAQPLHSNDGGSS